MNIPGPRFWAFQCWPKASKKSVVAPAVQDHLILKNCVCYIRVVDPPIPLPPRSLSLSLSLQAVATNKLRLPLSATAGCFAPLFETDVARAVAAITAQPSRPEFAGVVFNLTGPTSFTGDELAAVAANSTGNHRITFADITPAATATVLDAAGANLTQSEIRLIVGLVTLQTTGCGRFPSPDLTKLTGAPGTEISVFFAANKIAFGG